MNSILIQLPTSYSKLWVGSKYAMNNEINDKSRMCVDWVALMDLLAI